MSSAIRQTAASLRYSGQYQAALSLLTNVSTPDLWVICERAQCHFMCHQFEQVMQDYLQLIATKATVGSIEEAIVRIVYDFSRLHEDMAFEEAVQTAEDIFTTWLKDKPAEAFDEDLLSLLCLYHMIEDLGYRFLSDSAQELGSRDVYPPSWATLESLRARFLIERQVGLLAMIHLAERDSHPAKVQASRIRQTLDIMTADIDNDLRVYLGVLLAESLYKQGEKSQASQELMALRSAKYSICNPEAQWWAEYILLRSEGHEGNNMEALKRLLQTCSDRDARNAATACAFLEAESYLEGGDEKKYAECIKNLLERSHALHLPTRYDLKDEDVGVPSVSQAPPYSSFEFWFRYLWFLKEDMDSRTRLGLAISCSTRFFQRHLNCSFPQLKNTLANSLAESYEECGDIHHALQWTAREKAFAEEANDQTLVDEARFRMGFLMSQDAVKIADDPHGVSLAEWKLARRHDLEALYEEARQKGLRDFQFQSASRRLDKELDDEVGRNETPCGHIWLPKTLEALSYLPNPERDLQTQLIKYKIAHSKFDSKDFKGAAEALAEVTALAEADTSDRADQVLAPAFFTKARAHLHEYLASRSSQSWDASLEALGRSQAESEKRSRIDEVACCHVLAAVLWHARSPADRITLSTALHHISEVQKLWNEEAGALSVFSGMGLDSLLVKYSMRGRNESNPYSVLGLAVDICFESGQFEAAWKWVEYAKARAFFDETRLHGLDSEPTEVVLPAANDAVAIPLLEESAVLVHWAFVGDAIYLMTCRNATEFHMFKLGISVSDIEQWYQALVATREDFTDVETAEELLSELAELCTPLCDPAVSMADEVLVFCPTATLFKIPLHAISVDGKPLLERNPVVYTHSFAMLDQCQRRAALFGESGQADLAFLGNPTGDTPAGEQSARALAQRFAARRYTGSEATKQTFCSLASTLRLVHFHGHVRADYHPQRNAMLFARGEELKAMEVFALDLQQSRPAVVLIGCGSAAERLTTGDEPIGFISAFLYAGASTVLATLWPISDRLSGAAFSDVFYVTGSSRDGGSPGRAVDFARRLRAAALHIKAQAETAAPYFWAGFVLYGGRKFFLSDTE